MAAEPNSGDMERLSLNSNGKSSEKSQLVVCFGEMLIDFVPTVNGVSLAQASAFKKAPGGAPANVAVCIARLGGSSAFIGKVGDDEFGHMLADILKENKVDNSGMRFDPSARTALAFVTLRDDGEREFLFFRNPSADMLLREPELDIGLIKKATIFHYGSISLIEEPCRSTQLAAMTIAKKSGCLLSFDPNLRLALWPSSEAARERIMSIWDQADIIKVSEDEVAFLTGGDDPYSDDVLLKKLFHPKLHLLLVSEGSKGCRYYTKQFKGRVPGLKVKPVDTTGAGDAFVGGILYSLASYPTLYQDEKRLQEALYFANACGAITVTEKGAIPALPTKDAVQQLLAKVSAKVKVVEFELPRQQCVVYLDLKREECVNLFPAGRIYSQAFHLGGQAFFLSAHCNMDQQSSFHCFGLFLGMQEKGSVSLAVDYEFASRSKPTEEYISKYKGNYTFSGGKAVGYRNLFGVPWTTFVAEDSPFFINGILHLRAELTIKQ